MVYSRKDSLSVSPRAGPGSPKFGGGAFSLVAADLCLTRERGSPVGGHSIAVLYVVPKTRDEKSTWQDRGENECLITVNMAHGSPAPFSRASPRTASKPANYPACNDPSSGIKPVTP